MKIPFGWLPSSWGLKGTTREVAEAEYTLNGLELDDKLAEIKYRDEAPETLTVAKLKNRKKHNKITSHEYDIKHAHATLTGNDLALRLLDIQHQRGEINSRKLAIEKAKITLTGKDLEFELLHIDWSFEEISEKAYMNALAKLNLEGDELACELLRIQWVHGEITEREYKVGVAKILVAPGVDLELEILDIDLSLGLIEQQPYEKQCATIKGEPYICVLNSEYNPEDKLDGLYFEFDWNDKWIDELREAGYTGFTEDQIVERWFTDICRGVVQSQDQMYMGDVMPFNSKRVIKKESDPNGPTSYS
jgi:hypothetical protein